MTEQDTTPQDKTNTSQDNQNTTDNNTPDQTTTQHNAPHYITKSPQHNTKNLPLQVLGDETSAPVVDDGVLSALLMGITWVERGDKTSAVNVLGMTELEIEKGTWDAVKGDNT